MKARAISFAKGEGHAVITTQNASDNAGMLVVNDWLGFVRKPPLIVYRKDIAAE